MAAAAAPAAAGGALTVSLNTDKLNFDGSLSFAPLEALVGEVRLHDGTAGRRQTLERVPQGARILVTKEMEVDAETIAALPASVELIAEAGTGYNNIAIAAARARGITVCNIPVYSTEAMAHTVMTFVLSLSCSMNQVQRKLWTDAVDVPGWHNMRGLPHFELMGKTIGLIGGRGTIGSKVTQLCQAFGMRVIITSRSTHRTTTGAEVVGMDELLAQSDFVSVHCPLNDETRGSIGMGHFRKMKPTAFLINTARGAILNQEELCDALEQDLFAGAGIDVQEVEPPPAESRLWRLARKNVLLTPHIGWQRKETRQRLIDDTVKNIECFLAGRPSNVVN